ncbi:hypothetical protein [Actinoplanes sp. ATCC 53533]|nr:hypothetical protein [Actinoplanes sp. ATCC 53533]
MLQRVRQRLLDIDLFSFGYNAATPDSAYATADDLVAHLVDIVC